MAQEFRCWSYDQRLKSFRNLITLQDRRLHGDIIHFRKLNKDIDIIAPNMLSTCLPLVFKVMPFSTEQKQS
jgi:hypothetical protein